MAVQMPDQCYILRTIQIKRAFLKGLTYAMSAPHYRPSNQPLTKYPHKLSRFFVQTLMIAPQKLWQTLKKFDDPFLGLTFGGRFIINNQSGFLSNIII